MPAIQTLEAIDVTTIVDGVDQPLARARGLGNAAYTGAGFFSVERERVFAQGWMCAGVGADVASPGDVKPVDPMGVPLLLVRGADNEVRVFHNVCSHRGVRLVDEATNVKRVIVCPYHSWSYKLDGCLFSTPHIGGQGEHNCEGFDRSSHGLKSVPSAVWMDMVFVNLSGSAEPFETYIAPLAERWRSYDASGFVHGGAASAWELSLRCNWKLAVENHCDAYHLPWVHPGLNSYSRFEDHYEILERDSFSGQGSINYAPRLPPACPALPRADVPEHWRQRAEYISLFPNVMIGICADHYWSVWLEPLACDRTIERMNLYYLGEAATSDVYASSRDAMLKEWLNIWTEDRGIVELMQRGRASSAFEGGAFSPALDGATHELHRWEAQRLQSGSKSVASAA